MVDVFFLVNTKILDSRVQLSIGRQYGLAYIEEIFGRHLRSALFSYLPNFIVIIHPRRVPIITVTYGCEPPHMLI